MPATALKVVQLFAEPASTWGSAARATVKLIGVTDAQLSIDQEIYQPPAMGYLYPANQTAEVAQSGSGSVKQDGLYQDVCYWLDGTFGPATGSAGVGTAYIYNYAAPTGAISHPRSYTMEFGTTAGPYSLQGTLVQKLTIEGEAGKVWTVGADLLGKKAASVVLSTSVTDTRSVQLIRVADTVLAVGAWANSTYTNVTATLIKFTLEADPKRHAKTFAGSVNPGSHGEDRWEGSLTTVLEFNSTAKAYVDAMLSGVVQRRFRLTATGTPAANRIAVLEFAGTLVEGAKLFEDRDGNITVSLKWSGTYSSTLGNWLKAKVTNELAALR